MRWKNKLQKSKILVPCSIFKKMNNEQGLTIFDLRSKEWGLTYLNIIIERNT